MTRNERTKQNQRMSFIARHPAMTADWRDVIWCTIGQMKPIDVFPDGVLLEIFDFYVNLYPSYGKTGTETWQLLVHVCRRWRNLVFGSPRRLNLRLLCTLQTPAKDTLDIWPALPILIVGYRALSYNTDNVIAALEQNNRVCKVSLLNLANWQWEKVLAAMQVPFPELTNLELRSDVETPLVIPDSLLGGYASSLQYFELDDIPFPGLTNLLSSANHLVFLCLSNIPHSGYISPEAMIALLSALSNLRTLSLEFESPQSRPGWQSQRLRPPKRSILPALNKFHFRGVTEYLEELVTRIGTPRLDEMHINFFNQIDVDCPRLAQFINRTPALMVLDEARVKFDNSTACVKLLYRASQSGIKYLEFAISCTEPDWQLSSIEQVCSSHMRPLSTVEDLYIEYRYRQQVWNSDAIENALWLELLLPFTAVKDLYLSKEFAPGIAAALEDPVEGRITEVLPSLRNIFVEGLQASGPFQKNIGQLVGARQLSGHLTISLWNRDSESTML